MINSAPQPIEGQVPSPNLSTPEKRGEYLVTLASCADCHTPMDDRGQYVTSMRFAGGPSLKYGDARPPRASANLTPAPNGIPYYTEELFLETIRNGRVRDRQISDVMPWGYYRHMTDDDLKSIFAYLQTLAPIDHYVDNALPATACGKCKLSHGGGERNNATE